MSFLVTPVFSLLELAFVPSHMLVSESRVLACALREVVGSLPTDVLPSCLPPNRF